MARKERWWSVATKGGGGPELLSPSCANRFLHGARKVRARGHANRIATCSSCCQRKGQDVHRRYGAEQHAQFNNSTPRGGGPPTVYQVVTALCDCIGLSQRVATVQ